MTPFPAGNLNRVLQAFANGSLVGHAHGEGPVEVVWLHGWGRSGADFDASAARLGHASLALDLPGFGGSSPPDHAGGARLYADLLRPVLAGLGRPVVLVGHSFGGRVATVLAATIASVQSCLPGSLFVTQLGVGGVATLTTPCARRKRAPIDDVLSEQLSPSQVTL